MTKLNQTLNSGTLKGHPSPRILSLWAINDAHDERRLCRQLDAMKVDGFNGVVWHPRFYPGTPPYLSVDYLRIVSQVILHARDIGLMFWIYDENGWPSGVAGGELIRQYPDDAGGLLTLHEGEGADAWHNFEAQGKPWHLRLARTCEIDYLNPAACGHFLQIVHDRYRTGLDPEAWAYVEAFFTDEPEFGLGVNIDHLPPHGGVSWSPILPDLYQQRFGRDIREDLPWVFFNEPDGSHEEIRIRFWEFMTDRLCQGFFAPYHAWCRREGKLFTGHLKGDEHPLFQVMMNGSCHQIFQHLDMPGIDPLERFPFCDYYVREVAAAAFQFGTGRTMAEVMGGGGWGSTPEDLERFLLWLSNHGATDLVIHLHQARLHSHAITDWPPSNPNGLNWREAYAEVLHRVRRKTDARVVHTADTLVLAPYRGIMASYEPWSLLESNVHNCMTYPDTPAGQLNRQFLALVDRLPAHHAAHHFSDERSFEEHGRVADGRLFLGHHGYTTVILDEGCRLTAVGQRLLQAFKAAGGRVLAAGEVPEDVNLTPSPLRGEGRGEGAETSCAIHWDTATAPVNDLFLESVHDAATGWWRANVEMGSRIEVALTIEFADEIQCAEWDAVPLALVPSNEGSLAEVPSGAGTAGRHVIRFKLAGTARTRVFAWLRGDFRVLSPSPWAVGPNGTNQTAGPWRVEPMAAVALAAERTAAGWPFARGRVTMIGTLTIGCDVVAGTRISFAGIVADAVRLTVDGLDGGWLWGPDWSAALPGALQAGSHRVELQLLPSTYNRYGPHHHIDGDCKITSPCQFTGQKNFADRLDAPTCTHDSLWRVKPLAPPTAAALEKCKASLALATGSARAVA